MPLPLRCLRLFTSPGLLVTVVVIAWSVPIGVAIYRMLGVTIGTVSGRAATFTDEVLLHGVGMAGLAITIHLFILLIVFLLRIRYRWWFVSLLLVAYGTPLALFAGWCIDRHLWSLNGGGAPLEGCAPQAICVVLAWAAGLLLDAWVSPTEAPSLPEPEKGKTGASAVDSSRK